MRTLFCGLVLTLVGVPVAAGNPVNDAVTQAMQVDLLPFVHATDTRAATTAPSDGYCVGQGPTVWYSFTPTEDVRADVNTFGSNYDTTLSAYIADSAGIAQIACNDDAVGLQSQLKFRLIAGVTYLFMVGSYADSPGGDLVISFSIAPPVSGLQIDARAGLRDPGLLTLRGTIRCAEPSYVYFSGQVVQRRHVNGGGEDGVAGVWAQFSGSELFCSGATGWSAHPLPMDGLFRTGSAFVIGTLTICTETACDSDIFTESVAIRRTRANDRYSSEEQGKARRHQLRPRKS